MSPALERAPSGGLGRVALGAVAFAMVMGLPLLTLPLTGLLVTYRPQSRRELVVAALAGGISLGWLLQPGATHEQVMRAGLVLVTAAFVLLARLTSLSLIHRALLSVGLAAGTVAVMLGASGISWAQVAWWVRTSNSYVARFNLAQIRMLTGPDGPGAAMLDRLDQVMSSGLEFGVSYFPGLLTLQILAGLVLATAVHRYLRPDLGGPPGRFRDFRFSDHLGWGLVIPLLIVVVPRLAAAKLAAANALVVMGTLYALRGFAVAAFGAGLAGHPAVTLAVMIVATILMLPVVLAASLLLGILDTGLDLRRRWTTPPASE